MANRKIDGNLTVTGSVLNGSGQPIGASIVSLGSGRITPWDEDVVKHIQLTILNDNQIDYSQYSLFLFTSMGSTFIFLSSALLNTNDGLKACCSMAIDNTGTTNIIKARLKQFYDSETAIWWTTVVLVPANSSVISFDFSTYPDGYLFGVKL